MLYFKLVHQILFYAVPNQVSAERTRLVLAHMDMYH